MVSLGLLLSFVTLPLSNIAAAFVTCASLLVLFLVSFTCTPTSGFGGCNPLHGFNSRLLSLVLCRYVALSKYTNDQTSKLQRSPYDQLDGSLGSRSFRYNFPVSDSTVETLHRVLRLAKDFFGLSGLVLDANADQNTATSQPLNKLVAMFFFSTKFFCPSRLPIFTNNSTQKNLTSKASIVEI